MLEYITDEQRKLAGHFSEDIDADEETFSVGTDLKGSDIRTLSSAVDIEEVVGDCCDDLSNCQAQLISCSGDNSDLRDENDELIEENEELTDIVDGVVGSCSSFNFNHSVGLPLRAAGTICFGGVSGALTATWSGNWNTWTGNGTGSAGFSAFGKFVNANNASLGNTLLLPTVNANYDNTTPNASSFGGDTTDSDVIPPSAIGIEWYSGSTRIAFTSL